MSNLPAIQPPSSYRTAPKGVLVPYRYGEHRWEDYLLDTQALLYAGVQGQERSAEIQEGSAAQLELIASTIDAWGSDHADMIVELASFAEQTSEQLDEIAQKLDGLTEEIVWGFSTIGHKLDYHSRLLESIGWELKRIATILETPLATQANELVRSGQLYFRRGLYAEALSDFNDALAKRAVDPLLHLHLGQLYYTVRAEGAPFDLDVAEKHLALSLRYAKALAPDLANGAAVVDLAARTGAHLCLVRSGDAQAGGDGAGAHDLLRRGASLLQQVEAPSPDSIFMSAQIEALLGNAARATSLVTHLADADRAWVLRALVEPNLASAATSVAGIPAHLRSAPGAQSTRTYCMLELGDAVCATWASLNACLATDQQVAMPGVARIRQHFELGVLSAEQAFDSTRAEVSKAIGVLNPRIQIALADIADRRRQADSALGRIPKTPPVAEAFDPNTAAIGGGIIGFILSALLLIAYYALTPENVRSLPFGIGFLEAWAFGGLVGAVWLILTEASDHSKREATAAEEDRMRLAQTATQQQVIDDCERLKTEATQASTMARDLDSRVNELARQAAPAHVLADWRAA